MILLDTNDLEESLTIPSSLMNVDTRDFLWKDRNDVFHKPEDMKTSYLFFTLRMIWNHSVPEELEIKPFQIYSFGPFYDEEYFNKAVIALIKELSKRKDLTGYFKKCLTHMVSSIRSYECNGNLSELSLNK